MSQIYIAVVIAILIFGVLLYRRWEEREQLRKRLSGGYGKIPLVREYDFEAIANLWNERKKDVPGTEQIDDVTWNDLELDRVFERINFCSSSAGEEVLYETLHRIPKEDTKRERLEEKIRYAGEHQKEREAAQFLLSRLGRGYGYYLPQFLYNLEMLEISHIWIFRILQMILAASFALAIVLHNPIGIGALVLSAVINLVVYMMNKAKYELNLGMLMSIVQVIKTGNDLSEKVDETMTIEFRELTKQFRKISRMGVRMGSQKQMAEYGAEGLIGDYLLGITLIDFTKYDSVMKRLNKRKEDFFKIYIGLGEVDMAISLASFRESLPFYALPEFTETKKIVLEDCYHPMIEHPICNTIDTEKSCIFSGSNASGKSTFIKTMALNAILAQSIHTCMARRAVLKKGSVITSMAVRDNLSEGESYYIREIKYLNRILLNLYDDRLLYCFIDEILRGTNTVERIAASTAVLSYLYEKNCLAFVASHDMELTELLCGHYENFHFCEQIQEGKVIFDYLLRFGAATSRNAIRLLEQTGFPDEIVKRAYELAGEDSPEMLKQQTVSGIS